MSWCSTCGKEAPAGKHHCSMCERWWKDNPPFKPCVMYYPHANFTEVVMRDAVIVWRFPKGEVEVGYDAETGDLIAVRLVGDQTKRN